MRRFKLFFVISLSFIVMLMTFSNSFTLRKDLKAESTEIDDSPLGEKIVDIAGIDAGDIFLALTENGQVYAYGSSNNSGILGNGTTTYDKVIAKRVLSPEGSDELYLSNIDKIFAGGDYNNAVAFALAKDGTLYGWGANYGYRLGFPESQQVYTRPTIISNLPTDTKVKYIDINLYSTHILFEDGSYYTAGAVSSPTLGQPEPIRELKTFTKVTDTNIGPIPKIKEMRGRSSNSVLLAEDGKVYVTGRAEYSGASTSTDVFLPTPAKFKDGSDVTDIEHIIGIGNYAGPILEAKDGTILMLKRGYTDSHFGTIEEIGFISDPNNYMQNIKSMNRLGYFITKDGTIHRISPFGDESVTGGSAKIIDYAQQEIPAGYDNAAYISGNEATLILTNTGAVYQYGRKISFGDIVINGIKSDTTSYSNSEKYNDSIKLNVESVTTTIDKVFYHETNMLDGTVTNKQSASDSLSITLEEGQRILKKYQFYIDTMEEETKTTFIVDLYKNTPSLSDVTNNGKYKQGKTINLGYNGFSENIIKAKLQDSTGNISEYVSGTPLNTLGNFKLLIEDAYGNTNTYLFTITDKPVAESISFTKNPSGELIYANSITKANNQIGTISLVYPAGTNASTIASATVKNEGDGVNFEIKNNNQLYVKTSDLTAKEYNVPIEGEDANGMPFSGEVKITIAKATQTMAWDETSAKLADNGIALGDEVTLGVKDTLGNVNVAYGLKTPNSCITMTENKVKVTCIPNPASVTFTATPTGNDNYTSDPIELTVSISKKSISLKTVIQDSDSTFKDRVSVKVGDTTPVVKVVDVDGKEVSNLGTPELTFKKNGSVFADPTIESGTYTVEASYPSGSAADNYTITWTSKASLTVSDITIDENNASDYYTLTSDGKSYTPNTWTNQPIVITPVHKDFNLMSVENANTSSSFPYTYSVEGSKEVKLTFATADGAKASTKVTLNYDKTKPVLTSFQYDDVNSPVRAVLRSLFGFTHYFDQEKAVKFVGSDESTGSGVKEYTYEIVELNVDGSENTSSKKTGTLDSVNSVKLEMDKNYKITAKVIDNAGNISEPMSETVQLNDEIGELSLSAVSDGTAYDGSKWTSKAITITLTGSNKSGVKKYQYSTDGTTFIDFISSDGTITLPSPLTSIDNKTYTFRAVNNDTTTNDKTLSMKVDTEKPAIKVKGMIGNTLYDGSEVDTDVTIIPYQESDSLSDISYYYTSEASSKDTDPLTDTNWKKYTGVLSETRNGTHTYYVKGINGAGVQSDPADITIKIAKKEYTKVNVEVTSENQPYTSGTWAKHDITFSLSGGLSDESIVTGYEVTTTRDGSRPSATAAWTSVNGNKKHDVTTNSEQETYWFRVLPVDPNGSISKGTLINLDVEKPEKPTFTMEEVNTDALARFVNAVSFGQWMKAGVKVTINSSDGISGLDHFTYEEITSDGRIEKQSTNGILYYEEDAKLILQAKAYDKAGNVSEISEESGDILIDTIPPEIHGVKDQDVYKKYYYVYRTITYTDNGSGIDDDSAILKKDGVSSPLSQNEKIKDIGNYEVSVKDQAGNESIVHFQLVPLPKIDTEIDGTDESKEIIDQIEKELEEERNNLTPDEIKDYEKWIEDATKKWESERKKKLEDKETGTVVEGEGDTSFDPNTVLIVDEIDESKVPSLPRKAINVYDVYMKKGDTVIQPDGSVKVYLPYTEKETPIVYEIDENGNVKEIKGTAENGFVTFITDSLKKYAISNEAQEENKKNVCVVGPDKSLETKDDVCGSDDSTKNEDGSVDVPAGGKVIFPDKEINAPDGAHINPDGSVDFPDGSHYDPDGNLKPKEEEKNTCTAGPDGKLGTKDDVCGEGNGKDEPKKNEDGSVDVPDGGTIHFPDKEIDAPDGAHINPDGSVQLPDGTEYDKDGNKKPKVCDLHDGETLNVDTDKDGLPDINLDIDNNCVADLNIDLDDDRIPDLNIDSTGDTAGSPPDGKADINIDVNGDGFADINILKLSKWVPDKNVEINGFAYDTMSNLTPDINVDKDGDGKPDQNIDTDGDGIPDKNLSEEWQNKQNQNSGGALANSANTGDQTKWVVWWIIAFVTTITMVYQLYSYRKSRS